ncbi:hypothetical protein WN48_02985 [Eufriesea mexicana]|uniref:Uncharacterized protein n=1 Tax=Eufriesea mexicana TaxID=516756 RepID=A0A310SNN1_9HYME|nr:hypothetical protein WN48_02985 [Eufriesea mexicana]
MKEGWKNRGWRDEWAAGFKLPALLSDEQTSRGCSIAIHWLRSMGPLRERGRGLLQHAATVAPSTSDVALP